MKNVYIMGAGKFGKYVYDQLLEYKEDWRVLGYIDSDINKKGTQKDGVKIYYLSEPIRDGVDNDTIVFIAITKIAERLDLINQLIHWGFCNIFEMRNSVLYNNEQLVTASGLESRYVKKYNIGSDGKLLPVFEYLETHVMDGCNLKCKGCSHFSNLYGTNERVDFDEFAKDIKRVSEICNVDLLRLLGGEPLLNKQLLDYLRVTRTSFPYTDIRIATNGLLVLKCDENILKYMSTNNIAFDITMYKPVLNMKDKIIERLEDYDVLYYLRKENLGEFNKILTEKGDKDAVASINACERKKCLILKSGSFYRCPISAYVSKYNERYGINIESEKLFDIYLGSQARLWEIALENPIQPVSTCRYCANELVYFPWEQSLHPQKDDWLI